MQEDPPTAPEDDDECVEVAHSATLAFIESKLKKTDPITHGILKKRKSFLTLYRRHADLRCWRVKRCEDYDRMKKVRPFTLAKDWHAAGLYKKLIKFYANRIPTERLPGEKRAARLQGSAVQDAHLFTYSLAQREKMRSTTESRLTTPPVLKRTRTPSSSTPTVVCTTLWPGPSASRRS